MPDTEIRKVVFACMPEELRTKLDVAFQLYPDIAALASAGKWLSVCAALRNTARRYDLDTMLKQHLANLESMGYITITTSEELPKTMSSKEAQKAFDSMSAGLKARLEDAAASSSDPGISTALRSGEWIKLQAALFYHGDVTLRQDFETWHADYCKS
jgi:hypothetical protein